MAGRRGAQMRVLICGGGVIGTSIAYFLGQRGIEPVVIERTGIANAASGKSGGFLALDWCDGSPVEPLARRSFALHAELAETIDDEWGYRRLDTLGVVASARRDVGSFRRLDGPGWLAQDSAVHRRLGTSETTAQVNPADFTKAMMRAAIGAGARLLMGSVSGLVFGEGGGVRGVVVDGQEVAGDAVVIAMGPWSVLASRWLPLPAIYGLKGHSVIFRYTPEPVPHALFVELETVDGRHRLAGGLSAARRHDLCLRPLQRGAVAGGPRRGGAGGRRRGSSPRHDGASCARARRCGGAGGAGLLSPRRGGRLAAHRRRPRH